jgi:hypothetical protein
MSRISKRLVDNASPGEKDSFLWDSDLSGFGVKITPAGRKVYIIQYRLGGRQGKTRRYTIGRHGTITAEQARNEAKRLLGEVSAGRDPAEEKSRKLVSEIQSATTKLLDLLTKKENGNTENYSLELIDLEVSRLLNNEHGLVRVRTMLQDLTQASQNSLHAMQGEPQTAFKSGFAWAEMVRNLTLWAEVYGLPSAARNEGVSGDMATPFTEFVFAIQSSACFPKSLAAHMQSKSALGKAIARARKQVANGQI